MSCNCEGYIDCGAPRQTVPVVSAVTATTGHKYVNTSVLNNIMEFSRKTTRTFNTSWSGLASQVPDYLVACADGNIPCGSNEEAYTSACSENCAVEVNTPYYWDQQRGIYLWKHIKEELNFSVQSNKTAAFKVKWGVAKFHKIIIPTSVKAYGTEEFILALGGERKVLASVSYNYNPFPVNDIGPSTWGLYGNRVSYTGSPDTQDVTCILLFPLVPKLAMPLDADVKYYGFYDYNAIEAGFIENSLSKDDGGKDYFYPYWCRSMPADPLWRATADTRYEVIYSGAKTQIGGSLGTPLDLEGTTEWIPDEPAVYPFPFGSFALNSREDFIASCILQFGDRTGGKGVVYNEASMGDLFAAIKSAGVPLTGPYTALYPVTPL